MARKGRYSAIEHLSFDLWGDDPKRLTNIMTMVTAYLDESRVDDDKPYPIVGGYLGEVGDWIEFAAQWRAVLSKAKVKAFHAKDLWGNNKKSDFADKKRWNMPAKEALVGELLTIIEGHRNRYSIIASLDNAAYLDLIGDRQNLANKAGSQYELLGYMTTTMVVRFAMIHTKRPVSFVFDEGNLYRHHFERAYSINRRNPREFAPYLGGLTFGSDERIMPLQAADLFAWSAARHTHEIHIEKRQVSSASWAHRALTQRRRLEYYASSEDLKRFRDATGIYRHEDTPIDQKKLSEFLRKVKPRTELT